MAKAKYEVLGSLCIADANDMNVPVNCFLSQIDESRIRDPKEPEAGGYEQKYLGWFEWTAQNFMPRKERLEEGYRVIAPEKDTILELVRKHVVPLYEVALQNLRTSGENYFWWKK